jgi:intraflagellar transport protein 81
VVGWLEGIRYKPINTGTNAATLKREIQQMEEEKQQVLSKIARLKKKVEGVANRDQWLEAAKYLRTEQKSEMDLVDRIREQKKQVQVADAKLSKTTQALKDFKAILSSSSPEAYFSKMEEECRMNRFLAEDTLPKVIVV